VSVSHYNQVIRTLMQTDKWSSAKTGSVGTVTGQKLTQRFSECAPLSGFDKRSASIPSLCITLGNNLMSFSLSTLEKKDVQCLLWHTPSHRSNGAV